MTTRQLIGRRTQVQRTGAFAFYPYNRRRDTRQNHLTRASNTSVELSGLRNIVSERPNDSRPT